MEAVNVTSTGCEQGTPIRVTRTNAINVESALNGYIVEWKNIRSTVIFRGYF